MNPSVLTVLARFHGDLNKAIEYCERMAYGNAARITEEYRAYRNVLIEEIQRRA